MKAYSFARLLPAVLCALAACTEPQTPEGSAGPLTGAPGPTAVPTLTAVPTGASSVTDAPAPTTTGTAAPTGTTAPTDKLTAPYVLIFRQTGGIAGMFMETVVDTGSRRVTYGGLRNQKPESRDLTAEDVTSLTRTLEDARYASFPGKIKGGVVSDAFTYTIMLRAGGKEYTVSWEDGTSVPDPYSAVRSAVNAIRASRFDGNTTPKGAPTM